MNRLYEEQLSSYSTLFKIDSTRGNLSGAMKWLTKYYETNDSILAKSKSEVLRELRIKYQTAETENELLINQNILLEKDSQIQVQRIVVIAASMGLLVVIVALVIFIKISRRNKSLALQNEMLSKEQSHRVKNNLQMLASMIAVQAEKTENEDTKRNLLENEKRIQSLALLHRRLYERDHIHVDVKAYFDGREDDLLVMNLVEGDGWENKERVKQEGEESSREVETNREKKRLKQTS